MSLQLQQFKGGVMSQPNTMFAVLQEEQNHFTFSSSLLVFQRKAKFTSVPTVSLTTPSLL